MSSARTCAGCGQIAPIHSRRTGVDLCRRCYSLPERACGRCGRVRPIRKRASATDPDLCTSCYLVPTAICTSCGLLALCRYAREGRPTCERCLLERKIRALLSAPDGEVPPWAEPMEHALLATKNPQTMFVWLRRSEGARVLRRLVSGDLPLTHEALDGFDANKAVTHLRELLVASGALAWREPHVARVETGVNRALAGADPSDRRFVEGYLRWRVLPRLRRRSETGKITSSSAENAVRMVNEVTRFLTWLRTRGITVGACSQADVDLWLSNGKLTRRLVRDFVVWMASRGYMEKLDVPALSGPRHPAITIDDRARWTTARRLLHDESLDVADRVARILVLLYAQPVSRITQLTPKNVIQTDESLTITFGRDPVVIPEPLARLVRQLPLRRRRGSAAYLSDPQQWLFPGGRAGYPSVALSCRSASR